MTTKPESEESDYATAPEDNHIELAREEGMPQSQAQSVAKDYRGKWVAWDESEETALAWADTFPELVEIAEREGLTNSTVTHVPATPLGADHFVKLLDGESEDILKDVQNLIPDAETWLDSPNSRFGFDHPRSLVGTPREWHLRDVLRGIRGGIYT